VTSIRGSVRARRNNQSDVGKPGNGNFVKILSEQVFGNFTEKAYQKNYYIFA